VSPIELIVLWATFFVVVHLFFDDITTIVGYQKPEIYSSKTKVWITLQISQCD
jgi:hypothetical protein